MFLPRMEVLNVLALQPFGAGSGVNCEPAFNELQKQVNANISHESAL